MTQRKTMATKTGVNRLILIGNGFDLAHGLKTGYNDFIIWYLNQAFDQAQRNHLYEDELMTVSVRDVHALRALRAPEVDTVEAFIDHFYQEGFDKMIGQPRLKFPGWGNDYHNPFETRIKSNLLSLLLGNCSSAKWVDIENTFYDLLKGSLTGTREEEKNLLVADLNKSLSVLISHLEAYLKTINTDVTVKGYDELLNSPFNPSDFIDKEFQDRDKHYLKSTYVLNFNYTSTVEKYITRRNPLEAPMEVNYIHGKLGEKDNPIIFGFGDELDKDYAGFELERAKGIFEYIKSFWYFRTSNYHNLIRFIDDSPYQIFILGHSCGLSDRTMLNMVFEHENCKSVKIFYYQNGSFNNYTPITQEISRHFSNKQQMRKKIIPFDRSTPMPQANTPQ